MGLLIISNLEYKAKYVGGNPRQAFLWNKKGDIIDVPEEIVNDPIFQSQIKRGNLREATEDEKIVYILSGGKIKSGV